MANVTTTALLLAATACTGLLAGASLDQSLKQLPARHAIGVAAYSRYSKAADLGNGIALYATLGLAVLILNVAAAVAAFIAGSGRSVPIYVGATLAILHSAVTARAAPTNFRQRTAANEPALEAILDRFARLQALRCVLQAANFAANLWALTLP
jgi:hypothetical protein